MNLTKPAKSNLFTKIIKSTKVNILLIVVMGLMLNNTVSAFANQQSTLPATLEVGLFFRDSAKSTVIIKAGQGFTVNQHQATGVINLKMLNNITELILRKDSYYLGSGGNYVEYTGPIQEQVGQLKLQGPYHLQLGGIYTNVAEAEAFIQGLQLPDGKAYLVFEGGWRVFYGLFVNEQIAQSKTEEVASLAKASVEVVKPSATRVQVIDLQGNPIMMYDSTETVYFGAIENKGSIPLITIDGRQFRGEVTAKRNASSDMAIINKLPIEEYLYGVVPREMPTSWPLEALKAQAVAARGYTVTTMGKYKNDGFDLCNTTSSQVYGGYESENPNTNRAVDETRSIVVTYDGKPITPYYHSNSGGQTENSENIWANELPYIRGVKDPYSEGQLNATWSKAFTKAELQEALLKSNIQIGEVTSLRITEVSANGRVLTLIVEGTLGQEIMKKETSRRVFGLRSSWFTIAQEGQGGLFARTAEKESPSSLQPRGSYIISANGVKEIQNPSNIKIYNGKNYVGIEATPAEGFLFDGKGFGHGLGMSQYGAKVMAEQNFTFDQILTHYYTGVKVELR